MQNNKTIYIAFEGHAEKFLFLEKLNHKKNGNSNCYILYYLPESDCFVVGKWNRNVLNIKFLKSMLDLKRKGIPDCW